MGYNLIKVANDLDLYVMFSSITDHPVCWGSAEDFLKWTVAEQFESKYIQGSMFTLRHSITRLEEAEKYGDSSSCEGFSPCVQFQWGGSGMVMRSQLKDILELLEKNEFNCEDPEILNQLSKFDYGD